MDLKSEFIKLEDIKDEPIDLFEEIPPKIDQKFRPKLEKRVVARPPFRRAPPLPIRSIPCNEIDPFAIRNIGNFSGKNYENDLFKPQSEPKIPPTIDVAFNDREMEEGHCFYCPQPQIDPRLKTFSSKNDKTFIAVGYILLREMTFHEAQQFVSGDEFRKLCHIHMYRSINSIYASLGIGTFAEINSPTAQMMNTRVVNLLRLLEMDITSQNFRFLFRSFILRNTIGEPKHYVVDARIQCSYCSSLKHKSALNYSTTQKEKLVVMIGAILANKRSYQEGRDYYVKSKIWYCKTHSEEILELIRAFLGVPNGEPFYLCRRQQLNELMIHVNIVCSSKTSSQFLRFVEHFEDRSR